jgi:hypothetical protein
MSGPRKNNPDQTPRHNIPAPSSEAIEAPLRDLLSPVVPEQGLPLLVAAVLSRLWRQIPSLRALGRIWIVDGSTLEARFRQLKS